MSMVAFIGAIEIGLVYALLAFGVYITFRILNIPDLTVDGSFVLGAAVSAMMTRAGYPAAGLALGFLAGALAGAVTAIQQTKLGVPPILAGILTLTGLYTINLFVMGGRSNLALLNIPTAFAAFETMIGGSFYRVALLAPLVALVLAGMTLFFKTQLGLSIRATGDNEAMVRASSIDTDFAKLVALAIANGSVALSGAVLAQLQQSTELNMGNGMLVIGLASLVIGSGLIRSRSIFQGLLSVVVGAVAYRLLTAIILQTHISPSALKLISALVVMTALAIPAVHKKLGIVKLMKRGVKSC